jgi:hypothetical protein
MLRISTQSKVYVKAPIKAVKAGAAFDPRVDAVTMAFSKTETLVGTETWNAATWEASSTAGKYLARCLVGPGGGTIQLTAGQWYVFTKVTDSPEAPVLEHGPIEVF